MAKLEIISETVRPAPYRLACRRTNQLPMPASGASTTRLGTVTSPSRNGWRSERIDIDAGAMLEQPGERPGHLRRLLYHLPPREAHDAAAGHEQRGVALAIALERGA